jgi:nucleotide-binding universal stress UspA family protein
MRTEHRETQTVAKKLRAAGVRVDRTLMIQGPPLQMILEEVGKLGTDLLILGSHHHGPLHRLWFGDTAANATKKASCALLVVPL